MINNIYHKLDHVQGFTLDKKTTHKKIYLIRNQKTNHPFQADIKPQHRQKTKLKLLPKFFERFKNTDLGIHFLVFLASGVFCLPPLYVNQKILSNPFSAGKINFFESI